MATKAKAKKSAAVVRAVKAKTIETPKKRTGARIVNRQANGAAGPVMSVPEPDLPLEESIKKAIEELGELAVDESSAPKHLRELADDYHEVVRTQTILAKRVDAVKIAKKSVDSATAVLLEKLRSCTHQKPLPLFNVKDREADQANMLEGASSFGPISGGVAPGADLEDEQHDGEGLEDLEG